MSGTHRTGASGGRTGACGGGTRHRRPQVAAEFAMPEVSRPSYHCPHWRGLTWDPCFLPSEVQGFFPRETFNFESHSVYDH